MFFLVGGSNLCGAQQGLRSHSRRGRRKKSTLLRRWQIRNSNPVAERITRPMPPPEPGAIETVDSMLGLRNNMGWEQQLDEIECRRTYRQCIRRYIPDRRNHTSGAFASSAATTEGPRLRKLRKQMLTKGSLVGRHTTQSRSRTERLRSDASLPSGNRSCT